MVSRKEFEELKRKVGSGPDWATHLDINHTLASLETGDMRNKSALSIFGKKMDALALALGYVIEYHTEGYTAKKREK